MKMKKVAIIGAAGYSGEELVNLLLHHPHAELVAVTSRQNAGQTLAQVFPKFASHPKSKTLRFVEPNAEVLAKQADVVFLALPHGVAAEYAVPLLNAGCTVIDLSADFRLKDANAYKRYYGAEHPSVDLLGQFVYGLPELNRARIKTAKYVASPGCFATTIELGLLPLARAGLLRGAIEVVGITGSSGAGVIPTATTHHPTRAVNLRTYKPLEHQHIPEIVETLESAGARELQLRFVPVSAPLPRGIFATSFAHVDGKTGKDAIAAAFAQTFEGEPFVRVPKKRLPEVAAVSGSNYVEVGFAVADTTDADGRRTVTCFSVSDNLIKGGAGQAIQSMNLMLGLDERLTLEDPGSWP